MAKANLVLADGTTVAIEGSSAEVGNLLSRFAAPQTDSQKAKQGKTSRKKSTLESGAQRPKTPRGPTGYILESLDEGFFKSRRYLGDIQRKLEERGHIYAQTSLSPIMVRLARQRKLRRLRDKKGWAYVS